MAFYVQRLSAEKAGGGWELEWTSPPFDSAEGLQAMCDDMNNLLGNDPVNVGHYRVLEWERK